MLPNVDVPVLRTDRLTLRGWHPADVQRIGEIYSDPAVARWLGSPDPSKAEAAVVRWLNHWRDRGFGLWALEETATGALVGRVGLAHHGDWTVSPHDAEIGWTLSPKAWGHGYATEGARAALEFARGIGLGQIISITRPDNVRSRRVMERLGLSYAGETTWRGFEQVWYAVDLREDQGGDLIAEGRL